MTTNVHVHPLPSKSHPFGVAAEGMTGGTARRPRLDEITLRRLQESVVNITSIATVQDSFTLNIFQIPAGQGSGFVWDDKGHVVTNYHVVKGASGLTVTMLDQSVFKATVIGTDPTKASPLTSRRRWCACQIDRVLLHSFQREKAWWCCIRLRKGHGGAVFV